jgi:hypothetical protein
MLEAIDNLPSDVWGVRASGTVSRDDYERFVLPRLEDARREGRRLRFLYHLGPEFSGFTPGAAWEDFRVGLQYLRLFERCAVVTDVDWLRVAARGTAMLMPCPVKVFGNAALQDAIDWLALPHASSLTYRMLPERGVLVVEPHGRLQAEDFDALEAAADAWIESGDATLRGVVIHARQFPGWENLGSLLRHLRFVRDHHRKIRRVALAVDGTMAQIAPALVEQFVQAELKQFGADDLEAAVVWAGARPAA